MTDDATATTQPQVTAGDRAPAVTLQVTAEAAELIGRRGGTAAIDHIAAVGCGKQPEVAITTYLKGKDTSSYLRVERSGIVLLISPAMVKATPQVVVTTAGPRLWRTLKVTVPGQLPGQASCAR